MESLLEMNIKLEKYKKLLIAENSRHEVEVSNIKQAIKELEKAIEDWGTGDASYRIV